MSRGKKRAAEPADLNIGARKMNKLSYSYDQIAEECRVSKSAVGAWARGERTPKTNQRLIMKRIFGIPMADWDIMKPVAHTIRASVGKKKVEPAQLATTLAVASELADLDEDDADAAALPIGTTTEACDQLLREFDAMLADTAGLNSTPSARGKLMLQKVAILRLRAKIEFDSVRIKDLTIREHPDMKALIDGMCKILVKHPDAHAEMTAWLASEGSQY